HEPRNPGVNELDPDHGVHELDVDHGVHELDPGDGVHELDVDHHDHDDHNRQLDDPARADPADPVRAAPPRLFDPVERWGDGYGSLGRDPRLSGGERNGTDRHAERTAALRAAHRQPDGQPDDTAGADHHAGAAERSDNLRPNDHADAAEHSDELRLTRPA